MLSHVHKIALQKMCLKSFLCQHHKVFNILYICGCVGTKVLLHRNIRGHINIHLCTLFIKKFTIKNVYPYPYYTEPLTYISYKWENVWILLPSVYPIIAVITVIMFCHKTFTSYFLCRFTPMLIYI